MPDCEVAIIGLGAMGSATLYQLAAAGVNVIGLDRFEPPHTRGSSHGETRITRQAIGEGSAYVPFVLRSHQIWRDLETATGSRIFDQCGTLILAPGDRKNSHHGKAGFLETTIESALRYEIAHDVMNAEQVRKRFPQYTGLEGHERAYYEPGGGLICPERAIAAQLVRARELGATVRTSTVTKSVRQDGRGVVIQTDDGVIRAERVVVSAGAWTASLLGAPFERLLTVSRQVLHWFELTDRASQPPEWPVCIWMHGAGDTDYFYSFPPVDGQHSVKVATEQYAAATSADTVARIVSVEESTAMFNTHVRGRIAGVSPAVSETAACLYTTTPDRGFILDWHPEMDNVFVVSACSGHGFKHSGGIGEAVAKTVTDARDTFDLSPFKLARFDASIF